MVATSRAKCRAVKKQQTEQAWVNQFAESTRKQNERWEAKKKAPVLPSAFHWSPEIAKIYKKTDAWKDIQAMANNEFQACINRKKHAEWKPPLGSESIEKNESFGNLPYSDASLAFYLQKRKKQGKTLSPAGEKFLKACHQQCKPVTGFWPQNEAVIAEFIHGPWPFGDLPEKSVQFDLLLP